MFDTASEAAYLALLAQRVAACLIQLATAAQGKQSRKHHPLIPEYHRVTKAPRDAPLMAEGVEPSASTVKLGHYHTPKQFLSMVLGTMHPMDTTEHLEAVAQLALDCNLRYPPQLVELERKKNLLHAKLLAVQSKQQEEELHASLPDSLRKVLEGKRLIVWQKLLEKLEGVPVVGKHDAPACYPEKVKPASRKAAFGRGKAVTVGDHVDHLEQIAEEEVSLCFVEGPFESEEQVTAYFGHNRCRFVLVQGAEIKLRPIDDCLEAQINQGFTSSSYLKLQDIDYIAGLALRVACSCRWNHGRASVLT